MTKEKIEELKTKYGESIYEGEISFTDADDNAHKVEFIFRKPSTADIESHVKTAAKSPIAANNNLLQSLIIHPEAGPIIDAIRDFPLACGKFVDNELLPFLGGNVISKSRKL